MIDHDAIAARVRQDRETGTPGPALDDADENARPTLAKLRAHLEGEKE